ncbi:MAG: hypothetical protein HYV28_20425 [Ignavibacteriales bacterium]|nr:hypothetical protein [Ignavibacteriales bacterium]
MYKIKTRLALFIFILLTGAMSTRSFAQCGSMGHGQSSAAGHAHNQLPDGYRGQPGTVNSVDSGSVKTTEIQHSNQENNSMHGGCMKHGSMNMNDADSTSFIVREGVIDLNLIDVNRDRKVFQDQMHWNIISDESGSCPLCKMELLEVSVANAAKNLKENGFQVK